LKRGREKTYRFIRKHLKTEKEHLSAYGKNEEGKTLEKGPKENAGCNGGGLWERKFFRPHDNKWRKPEETTGGKNG